MAVRPVTPNIEFPPNLVQFPAEAATPTATALQPQGGIPLAIPRVDRPASLARQGPVA